MKVLIESRLACNAEIAWKLVQTTELLQNVIYPLIGFRGLPGEELPRRWVSGQFSKLRMYLFGFIPMGIHSILFERVDQAAKEIQSRESSRVVARWDHLIRIQPDGEGSCLYSDEVEIEAGWRTPFIWMFAQLFYRHRQRRWPNVARRLTAIAG